MSVQLGQAGLEIDGRTLPLLSGSMHYWRVSRDLWDKCLLQVKALGFPMVCTYIPWSVHEIERGRFDFGENTPEKDLGKFIRLAGDFGLRVMVRPGPHINAEITDFGFPARVLDDPRIQAVGPDGEPVILPAAPKAFAIPSYSSEVFWREVGLWFDAVSDIIRPLIHPRGPIVLIQCDNELSYFFRTGAYEQDYSDDALSAYRRFLEDKYRSVKRIGQVYGRRIRSFGQVQPPVRFHGGAPGHLPYFLDWAEFKERVLHDALARIRGMWEERGIRGILFTHNLPSASPRTPFNIPRDEGVLDLVGMDFYPRRKDYPVLKERLTALEGQSRFPWSPEFASGCFQLWPPISLEDQKFVTMAALMHGLKGFNFYMIVERERWYGSPITRHARPRPGYYEFYEELNQLITRARLFELEKEARVLVLTPRAYDRLEKTAVVLGRVPPMPLEGFLGPEGFCLERTFGFRHCVQIDHDRMRRAFMEVLEARGITFRWGDSESGAEALRRYPVVFCPSFEFMEDELQEALCSYMEQGGTLVTGPEAASRGSLMQDLALLGGRASRPEHKLDCAIQTLVFPEGKGKLVLITEALSPGAPSSRECLEEVIDHLGLTPSFPVDPPCERTVFHQGKRTVVYLANPYDREEIARVRAKGSLRFRDLVSGEGFCGEDFCLVGMRPWQVRVLERV